MAWVLICAPNFSGSASDNSPPILSDDAEAALISARLLGSVAGPVERRCEQQAAERGAKFRCLAHPQS